MRSRLLVVVGLLAVLACADAVSAQAIEPGQLKPEVLYMDLGNPATARGITLADVSQRHLMVPVRLNAQVQELLVADQDGRTGRRRAHRPAEPLGHPVGDEGNAYMDMVNDRIADAAIDVRFIADRVGETRGTNAGGKKIYTLSDVYPHADLVTYPSHYEGFGNAFLEAVYFGKPVVVNTYAVYARDIDPLGFKTIEMTQLVTRDVVEQVRAVLHDRATREDWAGTNYALGLKYFSYSVARRKLAARLANLFGEGI